MTSATASSRTPVIVQFRTSLRSTIADVLRNRAGWIETDSDVDWDFNWADIKWVKDNFTSQRLEDHQRLNHFGNHYELTRKDLLVKNLKRAKRALEKEDRLAEAALYDFFPATYVLPSEYGMFLEEFKRTSPATWIMKPIGQAQGRGIFLFNKVSQISDWRKDHRWKADSPQAEAYIVQRYIDKPYLVGGKKFDMRIYALVLSYSPLTVYLYRAGFARFSNSIFSMKADDISNSFVHLTNVAIQKTATNYDSVSGCKMSMNKLRLFLMGRHPVEQVNEAFYEIQMTIVRSLLSVQKTMINDKHTFELYGYDVMLDQDLKPWLIEVNASPSLSANTRADYQLKYTMLDDMLDVIDMEGRYDEMKDNIGGFDLIWYNGPVETDDSPGYRSFLGCEFESNKVVPEQ